MMTTYSPLKKIAAFGFAAMVLAACAAPSYTTGSASSSASGGSASAKYLVENVGDRVFFETDRSVLDASARGTLVQQAEWLNQNGGINMIMKADFRSHVDGLAKPARIVQIICAPAVSITARFIALVIHILSTS